MHPTKQNPTALTHPRSILPLLPQTAALLVAGFTTRAGAAELGAFARVFSWPDGTNNFGTYTKVAGGSVTRSAAGNGWKSYGTAGFHSLAAGGSATSPNNGQFQNGYVGGSAYWFEQITISSPTVAAGTVGRAEFTLYFDGHLSTGSLPTHGREYNASISYRWSAHVDGSDNVADPNTGESYHETITVFPGSYIETTGGNFRNQPRHHALHFRFGQPFDFTVALHSSGFVPFDTVAKVRMDLRCNGWNGFRNIHIPFDVHAPGGIPVTDATFSSQTGFNYSNPGASTYAQWASLYQLNAASMQVDSNGNRVLNLLEYALGRNPLDPGSSPPVTLGVVNTGGSDYQSITFTRPRLGARASDIVYQPQRSDGLGGWTTTGMETTVAPSTSDTETVTVRSLQPKGSQTSEFLRLEVTGP